MRSRLLPVLTILGALAVSLAACELAARLLLPAGLSDRVEIGDMEGGTQADCYPRARGVKMMYDLRLRSDLMSFLGHFHVTRIAWPGDPAKRALPVIDTMEEAVSRLRAEAPICMLYDTRDSSPRFRFAPAGFRHTLALLGDSFTFGQGVRDLETLPVKLAERTGWRVRSYARPGANIPEIVEQFGRAMADRRALGLERIVYVYVPNDPEVSEELEGRVNLINDLMNQRIGATPFSSRPEVRLLGRLAVRSALAAALLRAYASNVVARRTLRFYEDANDPARNPGFTETFRLIREMHDRAVRAGVDFVLVAYPMMLDFDHYPLASINLHVQAAARDAGVDFLDLLPAFERAPRGVLTVHPIDYHPNAGAAAIAAESIAGFLAKRPLGSAERGLREGGGVIPNVARPGAR